MDLKYYFYTWFLTSHVKKQKPDTNRLRNFFTWYLGWIFNFLHRGYKKKSKKFGMVRPKFFTPSEVSIHSTQKDLWVSFLGKVYDLTSLCETHQGRHSVTFCFCIWYESGIFLSYASWVGEVAIFQITQVWPVPLKTNQISWLALHFIHNVYPGLVLRT